MAASQLQGVQHIMKVESEDIVTEENFSAVNIEANNSTKATTESENNTTREMNTNVNDLDTEAHSVSAEDIHSKSNEIGDIAVVTEQHSNYINKMLIEVKAKENRIKNYKCDFCDKMLSTASSLYYHKRIHDTVKRYQCNLCNATFNKSAALNVHKMRHTGELPYQCEICQRRFISTTTLKGHIRSKHTTDRPYKCEICNKSFSSSTLKYQHKVIHNEKKFKCNVCDKMFRRHSNLKSHLEKLHNPVYISLECEICNKIFPSAGYLKRHLDYFHGNKEKKKRPPPENPDEKFTCDICQKVFSYSSSLYRHKKLHKPKTFKSIYNCNVCDRQFNTKSTLSTHQLSHLKVKPYSCKLCERQFNYPGILNDHIRTFHTKEKPYKCQQCSQQFYSTKLRYQHNLLHDKAKYQCQPCGKSFIRKQGLQIHMQTDSCKVMRGNVSNLPTNNASLQCETCSISFNAMRYLIRHNNQFHSEKKKNNLRPILKRRRSAKHHENGVVCNTCDVTFSTKFYLKRHNKRYHKINNFESNNPFVTTENISTAVDCKVEPPINESIDVSMGNNIKYEPDFDVNVSDQAPKEKTNNTNLKICVMCNTCLVSFTNMHYLRRHNKKFHGVDNHEKDNPLVLKESSVTKVVQPNLDDDTEPPISSDTYQKYLHDDEDNTYVCLDNDEEDYPVYVLVEAKDGDCENGIDNSEFVNDVNLISVEKTNNDNIQVSTINSEINSNDEFTSSRRLSSRTSKGTSKILTQNICYVCKRKFIEAHHLLRHQKNAHPEFFKKPTTIKQNQNAINETQSTSKLEESSKTSNDSLPCEFCEGIFNRPGDLKGHITRYHKKKSQEKELCLKSFSIQCDICEAKFNRPGDLKGHMTRYHKNQNKEQVCQSFSLDTSLKCYSCNMTFARSDQLSKHLKECQLNMSNCNVSDNDTVLIDNEGTQFEVDQINPNKLVESNTTHVYRKAKSNENGTNSDTNSNYCNICDKSFASEYSLLRHQKVLHKSITYCNACDKTFSTEASLHRHERSFHQDLLLYKCNKCDKAFSQECILRRHNIRFHNVSEESTSSSRAVNKTITMNQRSSPRKKENTENNSVTESNTLKVLAEDEQSVIQKQNLGSDSSVVAVKNTKSEGYENQFKCIACNLYFMHKQIFSRHNNTYHDGKVESTPNNVKVVDKGLLTEESVLPLKTSSLLSTPQANTTDPSSTITETNILQSEENSKDKQASKTSPSVQYSKPLICQICDKTFTHQQYLSRHNNRYHKTTLESPLNSSTSSPSKSRFDKCSYSLRCDICDKKFNHQQYLTRHNNRFHNTQNIEDKDSLDCSPSKKRKVSDNIEEIENHPAPVSQSPMSVTESKVNKTTIMEIAPMPKRLKITTPVTNATPVTNTTSVPLVAATITSPVTAQVTAQVNTQVNTFIVKTNDDKLPTDKLSDSNKIKKDTFEPYDIKVVNFKSPVKLGDKRKFSTKPVTISNSLASDDTKASTPTINFVNTESPRKEQNNAGETQESSSSSFIGLKNVSSAKNNNLKVTSFQCLICKEHFNNRNLLASHHKRRHTKEVFVVPKAIVRSLDQCNATKDILFCEICCKTFNQQQFLTRHNNKYHLDTLPDSSNALLSSAPAKFTELQEKSTENLYSSENEEQVADNTSNITNIASSITKNISLAGNKIVFSPQQRNELKAMIADLNQASSSIQTMNKEINQIYSRSELADTDDAIEISKLLKKTAEIRKSANDIELRLLEYNQSDKTVNKTSDDLAFTISFESNENIGKGVNTAADVSIESIEVFELTEEAKHAATVNFEDQSDSLTENNQSNSEGRSDSLTKNNQSNVKDQDDSKSNICEFCNKTFNKIRYLQRHQNKFHADKITTPFKCHICKTYFNQKQTLTNHMKKFHTKLKDQTERSKEIATFETLQSNKTLPPIDTFTSVTKIMEDDNNINFEVKSAVDSLLDDNKSCEPNNVTKDIASVTKDIANVTKDIASVTKDIVSANNLAQKFDELTRKTLNFMDTNEEIVTNEIVGSNDDTTVLLKNVTNAEIPDATPAVCNKAKANKLTNNPVADEELISPRSTVSESVATTDASKSKNMKRIFFVGLDDKYNLIEDISKSLSADQVTNEPIESTIQSEITESIADQVAVEQSPLNTSMKTLMNVTAESFTTDSVITEIVSDTCVSSEIPQEETLCDKTLDSSVSEFTESDTSQEEIPVSSSSETLDSSIEEGSDISKQLECSSELIETSVIQNFIEEH